MHVTAIIAAGGRGERFGAGRPKQLLTLGGVTILQRSVDALLDHPRIRDLVVALPPELAAAPPAYLRRHDKPIVIVEGGARRQDSVARAFARVPAAAEIVVIHDAARPLVSADLIERTVAAAASDGAAVAAVRATDTVKRGDADGRVIETLPREQVYLAQTPQAFRVGVLRDALAMAGDATDESTLAERAGHRVRLVEGEPGNVKITTPADLSAAERTVAGGAPAVRIGQGYDLHRLVQGRPLVLGGVTIPFDLGLMGHSDADVVCHAVTDAVLGAAGLGDIGRHFPDTDARWKGADSVALLAAACVLVREAGYGVVNVDVTVIAERPKLAPHADAMRSNLAGALGCDVAQVSVKAKTNEGVESMGAGTSMAAHAVAFDRAGRLTMRLRFAPSPTGQLHVGNARTALFNWLLARGAGGTFVLRIEDTDLGRSSRESEAAILEDVRWMGLEWTEGVDAGGDAGPYRQTERLHIYRAHTVELLSRGLAYRCFCAAEQLEADRQQAMAAGRPPQYVGRCRDIPVDTARRRVENGEKAVIRFRVPADREIVFQDVVRGEVRFHTSVIGDPVLVRSDGVPAYNFAVVVDDALMAITHVIRGEDHISNTPRQVLLYQAFGWTPPTFAHVPLVMGADHAPLSKRHGATSVAEFRARGYLPEALTNYLALLGWSPGEGEELLPLAELATRFRLEDVGKSAGIFDFEKLAWVNRHYLKIASPVRLAALSVAHLKNAGFLLEPTPQDLAFLAQVVPAVAASVDRLDQVPARLKFLFDYSAERALANPAIRAEAVAARPVVEALADVLASTAPMLNRETFRATANLVKDKTGHKGKALFHPLRLVLTGEAEGLELDVAVPTIERGAQIEQSGSGFVEILGARERAEAFKRVLNLA